MPIPEKASMMVSLQMGVEMREKKESEQWRAFCVVEIWILSWLESFRR